MIQDDVLSLRAMINIAINKADRLEFPIVAIRLSEALDALVQTENAKPAE
jgi:hypothetical protein